MPQPHREIAQRSSADAALAGNAVTADLIAVLVAVTQAQPRVLTIQCGCALPSGPFKTIHRSLQSGLRDWVEQQTRHPLGYVEQLYTFADRDRDHVHSISVSYLGLTQEARPPGDQDASWRTWYAFFPWEDHRAGSPAIISETILPHLDVWAAAGGASAADRKRRVAITFASPSGWDEELVLQRYELLWEAGLVPEARRDANTDPGEAPVPGQAMVLDHRRILATGIARLRAKIKYRPVVFELMPPAFTLLQLQRSVEAIAGRLVHKQNFRRLMEQEELVEETGETAQDTGGRPAKLFRFRRNVLVERDVAGTKLPLAPVARG